MRVHALPVLAAAVILVVLEITLLGYVRVRGAVPDLMLLFALFLSLHLPLEEAMGADFLLGLVHDAASGAAFGSSGLLFLLLGSLVALSKELLFSDSVTVQLLLVFAASFLYNWLYGLALVRGHGSLHAADAARAAVRIALYTAVAGPLCFRAFERVRGAFIDSRAA